MGQLGTWDYIILVVAAFVAVSTLVGRIRAYQDALLGQVRATLQEGKARRETEELLRDQDERRRQKQEEEERTREQYLERREKLKAEKAAARAAAEAAAEESEAA